MTAPKADPASLRRAVSDVMEGLTPLCLAAQVRRVSQTALRAALLKEGWVPPSKRPKSKAVRRRSFGTGRRHGT